MTEQKQLTNLTEVENEALKKAFNDSEGLLQSIRAVLLNLDPTENDKNTVASIFKDELVLQAVTKRLYPTLDPKASIGQVSDIWLGVEQMIFGVSQETIKQGIEYKKLALEMTKKAVELLKNPFGEPVDLSYDPEGDELGIRLLARNQYIRHIEGQLLFIKIIADQKSETPQETQKRLEQSSTR